MEYGRLGVRGIGLTVGKRSRAGWGEESVRNCRQTVGEMGRADCRWVIGWLCVRGVGQAIGEAGWG